jgi:lipopolysaccharide export system protein LptC
LNAISKLSLTHKGLLALLVSLMLWLIFSSSDKTDEITSQATSYNDTSDYAMTNFTMTIMDENGQPVRVIKGQKMAHYPEDDSTQIIKPIAQFIEAEKDTWLVTSERGETTGKGDNILLLDNVVITRKDNAEVELHTSKLNLDTLQNTAYTDAAVKMISPHGETNSVGLHATLDEKTINLHSRVKGHYDAPPPK